MATVPAIVVGVFDHVTLRASDREASERFSGTVLATLGIGQHSRDNGPRGEHPVYHDGCYAAFALDPDGHNVEVVNPNR
jgi:hypothetical protein